MNVQGLKNCRDAFDDTFKELKELSQVIESMPDGVHKAILGERLRAIVKQVGRTAQVVCREA